MVEDEETKLRSEAAQLRVDNWLASRVGSTEKPRSGDVVSHEPSGAASSSAAPAAAASGSVPTAVSSSSADERFRSDEVPVNTIPPNTEKWLRKFYMKKMATVKSYENKCATNYSITK